ncbi:MAG: C40 family peptidase [Pirellulales bacterium]|nr:C40 family peptidase [Pirellulales bacterium]
MQRMFLPLLLLMGGASWLRGAEPTSSPSPEPAGPRGVAWLARKVEPELEGAPERLPQYIEAFSRELGNDRRLCAFHVIAEAHAAKQVVLHGYVELAETHSAIVQYLTLLGFKIEDRLESLPASGLGSKQFGFVRRSHSYCFDKPIGKRTQENDCLFAEPLFLLREEAEHLLVHSREGYLGYIASGDVERVDGDTFAKYLDGPRVLVLADCEVGKGLTIPAGARLKYRKSDEKDIWVILPGDKGASAALPASHCRMIEEPTNDIELAITTGKRLIGTPYFWGGRTQQGIDCSGLVQMSYAAVGFHLPRDSYQQFYVGQLTATRWHRTNMRRGDTLYFLGDDGKIRHTAIYLGEQKFLQAVMPKVRISSFDPNDPAYDEGHSKSFAFAKRPLE